MSIVVVSGSRADLGPLTPVAQALKAEWLFVTPLPSNSGYDSAISCSRAIATAADYFKDQNPEMVVLLGDRYEILAVATAAHLMNLPIAHLSGGDLTEGSQDDSMRHAITKLAHLHFATCKQSADRILSLGEELWRVHTVGCPGIDGLLNTVLLGREGTLQALNVNEPYYLVAFQPATLTPDPVHEARELIAALKPLETPCIFTTLNTDFGGVQINVLFREFCKDGKSQILEMNRKLYLSAMKHCKLMIGNSSSGLYEAPTLKKAFVNVGVRQRGRLKASSVVDCAADAESISKAIQYASTLNCSKTVNPYGDGNSSKRIAQVIKSLPVPRQRLLQKQWNHNGISKNLGTGAHGKGMGQLPQRTAGEVGLRPCGQNYSL